MFLMAMLVSLTVTIRSAYGQGCQYAPGVQSVAVGQDTQGNTVVDIVGKPTNPDDPEGVNYVALWSGASTLLNAVLAGISGRSMQRERRLGNLIKAVDKHQSSPSIRDQLAGSILDHQDDKILSKILKEVV